MKQYVTKESLKKKDYATEHNPSIDSDLIDLLSSWLVEFYLKKLIFLDRAD